MIKMEVQLPVGEILVEIFWMKANSHVFLTLNSCFHFTFSFEKGMQRQPLLSGVALIAKPGYSPIENNLIEYPPQTLLL